MYPLTYYENFMRYEASDQVFVAMPFSKPFQRAYDTVIAPAIAAVLLDGKAFLQPRIINRGTTGSPDIHEQIFDAIIHSRMVIADMTVQSNCQGDDGGVRWQANANVAYEVGLACAWRNPEDILLIHQPHPQHAYSFDVQNLRHVVYEVGNVASVQLIADEIVRALKTSSFLAKQTFLKLIQSLSPSAVQFMHQESRRAFPAINFESDGMPIFDCRVHALSELLSCGAIKNRNVVNQGSGKGVVVLYQWTELGLRMLSALHAIDATRASELRNQIKSVPEEAFPPPELRTFPALAQQTSSTNSDMQAATTDKPVAEEQI
jgi:hypothetical protein